MCTVDTTCQYFGYCICGGCACNNVQCSLPELKQRKPKHRRPRRKAPMNFIQKFWFFAKDVSDTASFRQRYALVRKFK